MNILEFLKNGSGIHIKKKNRGKFTKYCHGKVTDECIRKAKASGNPTLVKRATFAANVRKWKHKSGGKAFYKGINILDSNPKAQKYVKKKYKMHQYGGTVINESPLVAQKMNWLNNLSEWFKQKQELDQQKKDLELYKNQQTSDLISGIGSYIVNNIIPSVINTKNNPPSQT